MLLGQVINTGQAVYILEGAFCKSSTTGKEDQSADLRLLPVSYPEAIPYKITGRPYLPTLSMAKSIRLARTRGSRWIRCGGEECLHIAFQCYASQVYPDRSEDRVSPQL